MHELVEMLSHALQETSFEELNLNPSSQQQNRYQGGIWRMQHKTRYIDIYYADFCAPERMENGRMSPFNLKLFLPAWKDRLE